MWRRSYPRSRARKWISGMLRASGASRYKSLGGVHVQKTMSTARLCPTSSSDISAIRLWIGIDTTDAFGEVSSVSAVTAWAAARRWVFSSSWHLAPTSLHQSGWDSCKHLDILAANHADSRLVKATCIPTEELQSRSRREHLPYCGSHTSRKQFY